MRVAVTDREARVVFRGLAEGQYAVALFHDQNGNGEFDTGLFGPPVEGFGFRPRSSCRHQLIHPAACSPYPFARRTP